MGTVIKFIKLRMQNFKCFADKTIEFADMTDISAKNGKGKTTINDAISWALFDKLADGTKADKIRPHDVNGVDTDFVEIVCELDIEVDGKPVNIVKTQKQKWVKHSGEIDKVNEGNENSYVVNTIPKKEKDFKDYFKQIISEDLFRFTSNANEFLKLKTADRRTKLFDLVSDITDADVIASKKELAPLAEQLEKYTIEELISRSKKAIADNNKLIAEKPARIDELSKQMVSIDVAELELQKSALRSQIADIEAKETDLSKVSDEIGIISTAIMNKKFEISDYELKANEELFANRKAVQKRIDNAETEFNSLFRQQSSIESEIQALTDSIDRSDKERRELGEKYNAVDKQVFDDSKWIFDDSSTICSQCGQTLPTDKIEERKADFEARKAKAVAVFEADKKLRKDQMSKRGFELKASIEASRKTLKDLNEKLEPIKSQKIALNADKNIAMEELSAMPNTVSLSDDEAYKKLNEELTSLNSKYDSMQSNSSADYIKQLKIQRLALSEELAKVQKTIDSADNSKIEERIEELKKEHTELVQRVADAEKELFQLEEFNRAKVNMLTGKINEHFKIVQFKMFEKQVNGGYKEICEATVNGSDYNNGLNAGHRILAELDIVNTLQKIHNVSVPCFCDNCERLDSDSMNSIHTDCQMIYLRVSNDEELVVNAK